MSNMLDYARSLLGHPRRAEMLLTHAPKVKATYQTLNPKITIMFKYVALSLAAAAALSFTSCTCPACQGSGLQVRTSSGLVPYITGSVAHQNVKTVPCQPCEGTGIQAFGAMSRGLSEGLDAANRIQGMTR